MLTLVLGSLMMRFSASRYLQPATCHTSSSNDHVTASARAYFMARRYFAGFSPLAAMERAISLTARASAVAALMMACA